MKNRICTWYKINFTSFWPRIKINFASLKTKETITPFLSEVSSVAPKSNLRSKLLLIRIGLLQVLRFGRWVRLESWWIPSSESGKLLQVLILVSLFFKFERESILDLWAHPFMSRDCVKPIRLSQLLLISSYLTWWSSMCWWSFACCFFSSLSKEIHQFVVEMTYHSIIAC